MQLNFVTVDVFTDRQFGGNPLAVVPDARGLSSAQMQAIAAEFNLSETTFVLPPQDAANTAQVRIFTPRAELPFAGHPNVGTAFVLAGATTGAARPVTGDTMVFEEKAGLVRIKLLRDRSAVTGARITAPQGFSVGESISREVVASACSLAASDIDTRAHQPCVASCGTSFIFAAVTSRAVLAAAQPRIDIFTQQVPATAATGIPTGIHLYIETATPVADIEARMFAPLYGVIEDPATGSANVALIALLASLGAEPDLRLERRISQGVDMGRPSLLIASAEKRAGKVVVAHIGGSCVPVMRGVIGLR